MPLDPLTPSTFPTLLDSAATAVAVDRPSGSATLTVVDGSVLGSSFPVRLTCFRGADPTRLAAYPRTHLRVTARSGNDLSVGPMDGYADLDLQAGDLVGVRVSAATFGDLFRAIAADEDLLNRLVPAVNAIPAPGVVFTQSTPAATWTIDHGLGRFPPVTVVDSAGSVVVGSVVYDSDTRVTVRFSGGFSGVAYLG